jgi:hypothetical protein
MMIEKGKRCEEKGRGRNIFAIPASKIYGEEGQSREVSLLNEGKK